MIYDLFKSIRDAVLSRWALYAVITVAILGAVAVYVNTHFIMPSIKPTYSENNEFVSSNENEKSYATLTMFYAAWCPYSKSALEVWYPFKEEMNSTYVNGVEIQMSEVDCEDEPSAADANSIEEYPTIILVRHGTTHVFDGKPTATNIQAFVEKALA
jgi:thiol-disulfide isomerase/thioredoxin